MLEQELKTFDEHLPALLGQNRGKFVLIKGTQVVDTFANIDDALKRGYEEFGSEPFLAKQVQEVEVPRNFTSHQLGI